MARLVRMDHTGHTTLAEWTSADPAAVEAAAAALRAELDAGYYAVINHGEGHAEQVRELAGGRGARDPPPPDRRRVSAASLPERASVSWRAPMDERRLRMYARSWTATTLFHTVPMVGVAVLLMTIHPVAAVVGVVLLAHAWAIPELYANRGAKVVKPRGRSSVASESVALGFLGDLVGHDARELHARTGLVMERGALGVWLVGEAGALLGARPARALLVRAGARAVVALVGSDRALAAGPARGRGRVRDGGEPRVRGRALAGAPAAACVDAARARRRSCLELDRSRQTRPRGQSTARNVHHPGHVARGTNRRPCTA